MAMMMTMLVIMKARMTMMVVMMMMLMLVVVDDDVDHDYYADGMCCSCWRCVGANYVHGVDIVVVGDADNVVDAGLILIG